MQRNMREVITMPSPEQYSANSFWDKLAMFGRFAGYEVIEKALWLYYAADRPDTPKWAKATVYSALAYFVLPVDAIVDILPIAGYTDDLAVIVLALTTIGGYVDNQVKEQTSRTLTRWFERASDTSS
jgi:uncharacterized membrane protein YkvA (DUF1232 family)